MPISSYSDDELLAAIRQDDEKAFEELFDRYWKQVHTGAYAWVLSMDATEEIVKNVFTSLWEHRATLSISHLPSYLHVATKSWVLNYIDSQLTNRKHSDYYEQFIAQHAKATDYDVNFNLLIKTIECRTNDLPEKPKNIFRLHDLEGLPLADITRSLSSLKRLFNVIPHNQQKG